LAPAAPVVAVDENGEEIDEDEVAAKASSSSNSNAAALAAATGVSEISGSLKNFRHHPDMENFYRFIYENDLRVEALEIINSMVAEKLQHKKGTKLTKV
jgi:hypothetical protein